jgi:hypothetical protein
MLLSPRAKRLGESTAPRVTLAAPADVRRPSGWSDLRIYRVLVRPVAATAPTENGLEAEPFNGYGLDLSAASVAVQHSIARLVRLHLVASSRGVGLLTEGPRYVSAGCAPAKGKTSRRGDHRGARNRDPPNDAPFRREERAR